MLITRGYISSWMGSEPTYTWGPDKTGCICMLLASFMLLIIHIYMFFSDWLVWCLPGERYLCRELYFRHFYSVQRTSIYTQCIVHWHMTQLGTFAQYMKSRTLKRRIQRQDPVLGQSRKWRLNSYGVQLLYGTLRIRGACFDCALPRHSTCRF